MDDDQSGESRSLKGAIWRLLQGRRRVQSEEDLQQIIDQSEQEGIINEEEGEMLQSIFEFGDTIVREIMLPRTDMACLGKDGSVQELVNLIIESGHSRIPVYEGSPDHIVGVVYAKDLLRFWGKSEDSIGIDDVMRPAYFVPESKKIEELLREFRLKRVHMAIVVDEYGGTSGLITIEDLLEEIVGDIQDEYDLEELPIQAQEDGTFVVNCRHNIDEFEEAFDIVIPHEHFDTVGGWVVERFGRVPRVGEEFEDGALRVSVLASDARVVKQIRVEALSPLVGSETP